jgi:hypothetical protein
LVAIDRDYLGGHQASPDAVTSVGSGSGSGAS